MNDGVSMFNDRVPALVKAIEDLVGYELLVGIPGTTANRRPEPGQGAQPINNATLGYIHEYGAPEANIPARPFLRPGINEAVPRIGSQLVAGARRALAVSSNPDRDAGSRALNAAGLTAQNAVRAYINRGIAPPLADLTLRKRAATKGKPQKGAKAELARRATGAPAGMDLAKPLVWTAQLRNSITYVLRRR